MEKFNILFFPEIPGKIEELVHQFKKEAYESDFGPLSFKSKKRREDIFCSKGDRIGFLISLEAKIPVGGLTLFKRNIKFKNQEIILGGIGGVWTRVDRRRRGIATDLLRKGIENLKKNHCDLGLLRADIKKIGKLYSNLGFVPLGKKFTFLGKSGKRYYDKNGMVINISDKDFVARIIKDKKNLDIGIGNW